jgi:F420H(2)-dependent quinone reductase
VVDDQPRARWWHQISQRIAMSEHLSRLNARVLHQVDRLVIRLTRGKTSATSILAGVPLVTLTTIGAKSQQPRSVPLLALRDGERLILIASNWGQAHYPAWYHNLRANSEATISSDGRTGIYIGRQATEDERAVYWPRAVRIYPGYEAYERRTRGRSIPLMVLTPRAAADDIFSPSQEPR